MVAPLNTPVADLGFDKAERAMLTSNMAKMTKGDLLVLQGIGLRYRQLGEDKVAEIFQQQTGHAITIGDISSLEHADLHRSVRVDIEAAAAVSCCCCTCTPCCSCTASVVIMPKRVA